jgi:hypothetical protein
MRGIAFGIKASGRLVVNSDPGVRMVSGRNGGYGEVLFAVVDVRCHRDGI